MPLVTWDEYRKAAQRLHSGCADDDDRNLVRAYLERLSISGNDSVHVISGGFQVAIDDADHASDID